MTAKPKKLLDQVREAVRTKHYSYRTEQTYVQWIKRFVLFHKKRHPKDMGAQEIQEYISFLANERKVASSTQNQALSAIMFCINMYFTWSLIYLLILSAPLGQNDCQQYLGTRKP